MGALSDAQLLTLDNLDGLAKGDSLGWAHTLLPTATLRASVLLRGGRLVRWILNSDILSREG